MNVGYSGTPLADKLGLKSGMRIGLDDPPPEFVGITLMPVPPDVTMHTQLRGNMDVVIGFYTERGAFEKRLPVMRRRIPDSGAIWVAWPKKASRIPTDMSEDVVREVALPTGLVDNKVCAIDQVWSGLRLVVRRELRQSAENLSERQADGSDTA